MGVCPLPCFITGGHIFFPWCDMGFKHVQTMNACSRLLPYDPSKWRKLVRYLPPWITWVLDLAWSKFPFSNATSSKAILAGSMCKTKAEIWRHDTAIFASFCVLQWVGPPQRNPLNSINIPRSGDLSDIVHQLFQVDVHLWDEAHICIAPRVPNSCGTDWPMKAWTQDYISHIFT